MWRAQITGGRRRGRPNLRWMNGWGIEGAGGAGMNVEQGREMAWNRNEWKRLVDGER